MPKNRKTTKTVTGGIIRTKASNKLRIGTRKSGVSAFSMTSDALKDVLNDVRKARYHTKAITVLRSRGIEINWPGNLDKVATLEDLAHDMNAGHAG